MEKFVPRDKMSKKQKKELAKQRRGDWGAITPITRVVRDRKKYRRAEEVARQRRQQDE